MKGPRDRDRQAANRYYVIVEIRGNHVKRMVIVRSRSERNSYSLNVVIQWAGSLVKSQSEKFMYSLGSLGWARSLKS